MITEIIRNKAFFIAEIGINHNGSISSAMKMIDAAAAVRADAVKFQVFKADALNSIYAKSLLDAGTEIADSDAIDFFSCFELSMEDMAELKSHAEKRGILFFSSVFDDESLDLLEGLGTPLYKIASSEITNLPLIKRVARLHKPIILSTGISKEEEIAAAVDMIHTAGSSELVLLHCVSRYPTPPEQVNLNRIISLKERFHLDVGFSDHTDGIHACAFAACYGARIFEKHFMLEDNDSYPDRAVSLTPERFAAMMRLVNEAVAMAGDGQIDYGEPERDTARAARRSLFARREILPGTIIGEEDLIARRPGVGIPPSRLDEVAGKRAKRRIKIDSMIRKDDYE